MIEKYDLITIFLSDLLYLMKAKDMNLCMTCFLSLIKQADYEGFQFNIKLIAKH